MKNTVTQEMIDNLVAKSKIKVKTIFKKCTIVVLKLPNGFILTESSACVDKDNYDPEIGKEICLNKIKDRLWELEGYRLSCEIYESKNKENNCHNCGSCNNCADSSTFILDTTTNEIINQTRDDLIND